MNPTSERDSSLVFPLWPATAPGSEDWTWEEIESSLPSGDRVIRNVAKPSLTLFRPEAPNGRAVIICPGGAFHFLSIDFEGTEVARWLSARGVTAFVLRYRLVHTEDDFLSVVGARLRSIEDTSRLFSPLYPLLQADISRSIQVVRERSADWHVNPEQVGVLGFSAGAVVSVLAAQQEALELRPNFIAPIYCGPLPPLSLLDEAPPMFTLCARDDEMAVANTSLLFEAYQAAKLPVEMHIYSTGGHGFGMKQRGIPVDQWIERFHDWLVNLYA